MAEWLNIYFSLFAYTGPGNPQWGVANYPGPPRPPAGEETGHLDPVLHEYFSNMAASAAQTRVKEEVGRSIEKLEKEQLRGLQVSKKSAGACVT